MGMSHDSLSKERKMMQATGEVPGWYTTQGYSLFKDKYAYKGETVRGAFMRIAKHLSQYAMNPDVAKIQFFHLLWSGKLAPSTPVMTNVGTERGMSVSCAGSYIGDSVSEFYKGYGEIAMLSKLGFGTASYLGDIRSRGTKIKSSGGKADGVVPVFDSCLDTVNKISQGSQRRGAWAGYIPFMHDDFEELLEYVRKFQAGSNLGVIFEQEDIDALNANDPEAVNRFAELLYLRARTGKGYMWKNHTANALAPQAIKNAGFPIKGSQLCSEIALPADKDHTFTCILSSLNLALWDEITRDDIMWSVYFLDAICSDFLKQASGIEELHKAVRFTEKARALGLGTLGFHTYLQSHSAPFGGSHAKVINHSIYNTIRKSAEDASRNLADFYGEPEWCKGTGMRNATLMTIAPNMSSALLCGSVSQGVEPIITNAYIQQSAGGEYVRYNPTFVALMREKGQYSEEALKDIAMNHGGSVQHLEWLSEHEKDVFKTAYEIDQFKIIELASDRQRDIDQAQSINLFFAAEADEKYVAEVHKAFLLDPYLKSLYYLRSTRGVVASKGECGADLGSSESDKYSKSKFKTVIQPQQDEPVCSSCEG